MCVFVFVCLVSVHPLEHFGVTPDVLPVTLIPHKKIMAIHPQTTRTVGEIGGGSLGKAPHGDGYRGGRLEAVCSLGRSTTRSLVWRLIGCLSVGTSLNSATWLIVQ